MSKLAVWFLLAALSPLARSATPMTITQLEKLLTSLPHWYSDEAIATELSAVELTERATSVRLLRWQTDFHGKKTHDALLALADASSFLDLPASDLPATPMPDAATRQRILSSTIEYVKSTIHKLPNFLARRETKHFNDMAADLYLHTSSSTMSAHGGGGGGDITRSVRQLHAVSKAAAVVTYRDGFEVPDERAKYQKRSKALVLGMTTSGEFGPILTTVIGDAIHGKVSWGHWEKGANGPLAVLRYEVPQEKSHYAVAVGTAAKKGPEQQFPAYHGEIGVDPATGSILRLTLESEVKPPEKIFQSSVLVEYGSVTIGNGVYICPLKGVALSKLTSTNADETLSGITRYLTYLNDVSFTEYHLFKSEAHILPNYNAAQ